jgi:flagellar protein FlaG
MEVQSSGSAIPAAAISTPKAAVASEAPAAIRPTPVETALAVRQAAPAPTLAELAQAVKNLNKAMQDQAQNLEFSIDSDTDRTIVKVIDQSTHEVLRQIPSQEALEIAKALDQSSGLLIRQKA